MSKPKPSGVTRAEAAKASNAYNRSDVSSSLLKGASLWRKQVAKAASQGAKERAAAGKEVRAAAAAKAAEAAEAQDDGPLSAVRAVAALTDAVIIGVSCGKDSLAVLELCSKHFSRIAAYFMYQIPGMSFQERYLGFLERRYKVQIIRLPHWTLGKRFQSAAYRPQTSLSLACPAIKAPDVREHVRRQTGIDWFATGEKICDSMDRRKWLQGMKGINRPARLLYPIWNWSDAATYGYLKRNAIPLPPDYRLFGQSFGHFRAPILRAIRDEFPNDFAKIKNVFPLIEAVIARDDYRRARAGETPELRPGANPPLEAFECALQPPDDRQARAQETEGSVGEGGTGRGARLE